MFTRTGTNGNLAADLRVNYSVSGAAADNSRVDSPGGSVVIPAGARKAKVQLHAINNGTAEVSQSIKIKVEQGLGYIKGNPSKAKVLISDNAP